MQSQNPHTHHEINKNNLTEIHLPPFKTQTGLDNNKPNESESPRTFGGPDSLEHLFYELNEPVNEQTSPPNEAGSKKDGTLDDEINKALMSFNKFNRNEQLEMLLSSNPQDSELPSLSSSSSDNGSPFDSPDTLTSIATHDDEFKSGKPQNVPVVNASTVSSIKQVMINTSKLNSLFTTLKVTYLKLCKEFNYLLSKFNENEKVKIELIHENNELKRLLAEMIKEREKEKRQFEQELTLERNKHKMCHIQPARDTLKKIEEEKDTGIEIEDSRTKRRKRRAEELSK